MKKFFLKNKVLWGLLVLELLLGIACLTQMSRENHWQQVFSGNVAENVKTEAFYGEAGITKVIVEYSAAEGTVSAVEILNENNIYKSTYANMIKLVGGQNVQSTTVWLTKDTKNLCFQIKPAENANLNVQTIKMLHTNQGIKLALTCVFLGSILIDGLWVLHLWIKERPDKKQCRWTISGIIGITLVASLPLLVDYCMSGEELHFHLLRMEGLKDGILLGQMPEWLLFDWLEGDGYLALLFPAFLRAMEFPVQTAYIISLLVMNLLATIISCFSFKAMFGSQKIGLIGSMLYVWAPYRLDAMYAKADVGESLAICFIPFVVLGVWQLLYKERSLTKKSFIWLWLAIGFTCIFWSNIVTAQTVMLFVVVLCILCIKKVCNKYVVAELCKTIVAVVILNIPMLIQMMRYVLNRDALTDYSFYEPIQHKGIYLAHIFTTFFGNGDIREFSSQRMQGTAALGIGFVLVCLMLLYIWTCYTGKYHEQRKNEDSWLFTTKIFMTGLIMLIMSTSYFPWDAIREKLVIKIITADWKTPAEFLPIATVCLVILGCRLLKQIWESESKEVGVFSLIATVGICFITTQFLAGDFLRNRNMERIYAGEYLMTIEEQYVEKS